MIRVELNERSYEIVIKRGSLDEISQRLTGMTAGKNIVVITHPNLHQLYGKKIINDLTSSAYNCTVLEVPEGEASKSLSVVSLLLDKIFPLKLDRTDSIIALGGGVIGDLAGFTASIYLRGIRLIQIPTTLLSQVDSSVGGKTGVNHSSGKNLIGSFYQPALTLIDPSVLKTLDKRNVRSAVAEIIKYGVIKDATFFEFLEKNATQLARLDIENDFDLWAQIIETSCKIKAEVVSIDEQESGLRAILNFGHTVGHAIEACLNYGDYYHGECVSFGMLAATDIAVSLNLLSKEKQQRIVNLIHCFGFERRVNRSLSSEALFEKMTLDKKVKNNRIRMVLPTDIGSVAVQDVADKPLILKAINAIL